MFAVNTFLMYSSLLFFVRCLFVFKYKCVQQLNHNPNFWQIQLAQCSFSLTFCLTVAQDKLLSAAKNQLGIEQEDSALPNLQHTHKHV